MEHLSLPAIAIELKDIVLDIAQLGNKLIAEANQ